jgi:hypothetical protein
MMNPLSTKKNATPAAPPNEKVFLNWVAEVPKFRSIAKVYEAWNKATSSEAIPLHICRPKNICGSVSNACVADFGFSGQLFD